MFSRNIFTHYNYASSMMLMLIKKILFLSITTLLIGHVTALISDREILNGIYEALNGDEWDRGYDSWFDPLTSICEWEGVTCDPDTPDERVLSLELSRNSMYGEVPMTLILQLPSLRTLNLDDNDLTFPKHLIGEQLSDENRQGIHSKLRHIKLSYTSLTNVAGLFSNVNPNVPVIMPDLETLYLNGCDLSGEFPPQILEFSQSLTELNLGDNGFTGTLPAELNRFKKLKILDLSDNEFDDEIPDWLDEMPSLEVIDLEGNYFSGTLKDVFLQLPNLKHLDLASNELSGTIYAFDSVPGLLSLDLSYNFFEGTIPNNFLNVDPDEFMDVDIGGNDLTGTVPANPFKNLEPFTFLLYQNKLSGIAESLCNSQASGGYGCNGILCPPGTFNEDGMQSDDEECEDCADAEYWGTIECGADSEQDDEYTDDEVTWDDDDEADVREMLEEFYEETGGDGWHDNTNWLEDDVSVCDWYGITCSNNTNEVTVTKISLQDNNLVGRVPDDIFIEIPLLEELILPHNSIIILLDMIGEANKLSRLNLVGARVNNLDFIQQAKKLKVVELSNVDISGHFPIGILDLKFLESLEMWNCNIEGTIPEGLGQLKNLKHLNLNGNKFTGTIPSSLMNFNMDVITLKENHLTGSLPDLIETMSNIRVFDVFKNQLTGTLPSFQNMPKLERLSLRANFFTGNIPPTFLAKVKPGIFLECDLAWNNLSGRIPNLPITSINVLGNMFTDIDPEYCQKFVFGCDELMCPVGMYSNEGRTVGPDMPCLPCPTATIMGSITCPDEPIEPKPRVPTDDNSGDTPSVDDTPLPPKTEHEILSRFYTGTNGPKWYDNGGWLNGDNPCKWFGIECEEHGLVTRIDLDDNGLGGSVPDDIWDLQQLQFLKLSNNPIQLSFKKIGQATNLEELDLAVTGINNLVGLGAAKSLKKINLVDNGIQEGFPSSIYKLTGLREILLYDNFLTGTVPDFKEFTLLERLLLESNEFKGTIPNFDLPEITELTLNDNLLTGTVPDGILKGMPQLETCDLSDNKSWDEPDKFIGLSGPLPLFKDKARLRYLDLSYNSFTGTISAEFLSTNTEQMKNIEEVDVSHNKLTGTVPNFLEGADTENIILTANQFTGIDPKLCARATSGECDTIMCHPGSYSEEGRMTDESSCETCPQTGNLFYGMEECESLATSSPTQAPVVVAPIDKVITEKEILGNLFSQCGGDLWTNSENWLSGVNICEWHGIGCNDAGKVISISLDNNNLAGRPPQRIFQLEYLQFLSFSNNDILFDFSNITQAQNLEKLSLAGTKTLKWEDLANAKGLKELRVNDNNVDINGLKAIVKLTNLEKLVAGNNPINAPLPDEIGNLKNLRLLSIVKSNIMGTLPSELGKLKLLKSINLSNNNINGQIPVEFLDNDELTDIDISHNNLIGNLPSMGNKKKLVNLDLSGNQYSGPIPSDFLKNADSTLIERLDLSDNRLTGTITEDVAFNIRGIKEISSLDLTGNRFDKVDSDLCDNLDVDSCDWVLCPKGTFNHNGRKTKSSPCEECEDAKFLGTKDCDDRSTPPPVITKPVKTTPNSDSAGPTRDSDDEYILDNFFDECDGRRWFFNENWGVGDFCTWHGVTCVEGLKQVETLDLGYNNIKCSAPAILLSMSHLKRLSLYGNPITINFSKISLAESLETLEIDNTPTTILFGIDKAPALRRLSLRACGMEGDIPSELASLKKLEYLNLAHNRFGGHIPSTMFSSMTSLKTLILRHNNFEGGLRDVTFPDTLVMLDLSANKLDGPLPTNFLGGGDGKSAYSIDLSDNLLTGTVSSSFVKMPMLTLELGGNFFTGLDKDLCQHSGWNDGAVGEHGCDGLMCPRGTSARYGRHAKALGGGPCEPCSEADHWGSDKCYDPESSGGMSMGAGNVVKGVIALVAGMIMWS